MVSAAAALPQVARPTLFPFSLEQLNRESATGAAETLLAHSSRNFARVELPT